MTGSEPYEPLPPFRASRRFRLGVTSYVYPADLLANVRRLAGRVDDIELVLFESSDVSNLPTADDVAELAALAARHGLTYTVHFPIDRKLGSADRDERRAMVAQVERIVALTRSLDPFAYILHLEGVEGSAPPERVAAWQRDVGERLPDLVRLVDRPDRLCVENLKYPLDWHAPWLDRFGLGVCLDVGHLWLQGGNAADALRRETGRTRVIHFHGVREGRDHLAVDVLPPAELRAFVDAIRGFAGVLTLEVFEYAAARRSMEALERCLQP